MKNNFTIGEFNGLPETGQFNIIWQHAFMMGKRTEGDYEITLFSLFSFYVELYYNLKVNFFKEIKAMPTIENPEGYKQLPSFKSKLNV